MIKERFVMMCFELCVAAHFEVLRRYTFLWVTVSKMASELQPYKRIIPALDANSER